MPHLQLLCELILFLADSEEEELNVEDEMALDGGKQSDSDVCEFVSFCIPEICDLMLLC